MASIRDVFEKELEAADEKYKKDLKAKEDAAKTAKEATDALEAKVGTLDKQIQDAQKKLDETEQREIARQKDELFQTRMSHLDSKYDLSDPQKQAIASQIKELDDKAFEQWEVSFALFAAVKKDPKQTAQASDGEKTDAEKAAEAKVAQEAKAAEDARAAEDALNKAKGKDQSNPSKEAADKNDYGTDFQLNEGIILVK